MYCTTHDHEATSTNEQLMEYITNNLVQFICGEFAGYRNPTLAELYTIRGFADAAIAELTTTSNQ